MIAALLESQCVFLSCFCDSSVACRCALQCVFPCEFACLLSHTSHLIAPLNAANRKQEGWDKEPACKKKKKHNRIEFFIFIVQDTMELDGIHLARCFSVLNFIALLSLNDMLLPPLTKILGMGKQHTLCTVFAW